MRYRGSSDLPEPPEPPDHFDAEENLVVYESDGGDLHELLHGEVRGAVAWHIECFNGDDGSGQELKLHDALRGTCNGVLLFELLVHAVFGVFKNLEFAFLAADVLWDSRVDDPGGGVRGGLYIGRHDSKYLFFSDIERQKIYFICRYVEYSQLSGFFFLPHLGDPLKPLSTTGPARLLRL